MRACAAGDGDSAGGANPNRNPDPSPSPNPSPHQVLAVVKEELLLGEPIDSIFKEFDPVPLGSASIAQAAPG